MDQDGCRRAGIRESSKVKSTRHNQEPGSDRVDG